MKNNNNNNYYYYITEGIRKIATTSPLLKYRDLKRLYFYFFKTMAHKRHPSYQQCPEVKIKILRLKDL